MKSLKYKTISGISWSITDSMLNLIVTMLIGGILARLLRPEDFGVMAIVYVFTGFLRILRDFGVGASIIQKSDPTQSELNSLFWLSILLGFIASLVLISCSYLIASFYDLPMLGKYIRVISVALFVGSISIVPEALIKKELSFKSLFYRNIGTLIVSGAISILMAYNNFGVWSLICKEIVFNTLLVFFSFNLSDWRPSVGFNYRLIKPYLSYSLPLLGENSLNYFVRNIDNLLIGKLLGNVTLGLYSKGYGLMQLPVRQISGAISNVMFPSLSAVKNEKERVWDGYMNVVKVVSVINIPIMISLYYFSREVVLLLFGNQWLDVVPIIKSLCLIGSVQSIGTLSGSIYNSQGETKLQLKVGIVAKMVISGAIIYGLTSGGIEKMIFLYTIVSSLILFFELYFVTKILDRNLRDFASALKKELVIISMYLFTMTTLFRFISEGSLASKLLFQFIVLLVFSFLSIRFDLFVVRLVTNYFKKSNV